MARRFKKLFKIALFVLLVVVPFFVPIYLYYTVDEPPPDDADLRVERADVPREENGFYLAQFEQGEIWLGSEDEDADGNSEASLVGEMILGRSWRPELAERVLSKNRDALCKLDLAVQAQV